MNQNKEIVFTPNRDVRSAGNTLDFYKRNTPQNNEGLVNKSTPNPFMLKEDDDDRTCRCNTGLKLSHKQ